MTCQQGMLSGGSWPLPGGGGPLMVSALMMINDMWTISLGLPKRENRHLLHRVSNKFIATPCLPYLAGPMDVTARAELSLPPPSDKTSPAGSMVCYLQVQEVRSLSLVLFVTVTSFCTSTQVCARARCRGVGCEAPSSATHLVLLRGSSVLFWTRRQRQKSLLFVSSLLFPSSSPSPPLPHLRHLPCPSPSTSTALVPISGLCAQSSVLVALLPQTVMATGQELSVLSTAASPTQSWAHCEPLG